VLATLRGTLANDIAALTHTNALRALPRLAALLGVPPAAAQARTGVPGPSPVLSPAAPGIASSDTEQVGRL